MSTWDPTPRPPILSINRTATSSPSPSTRPPASSATTTGWQAQPITAVLFGADPLGRFVVAGQGQFSGLLQVTAANGTEGNLSLGSGVFPQEIFVGPDQHFIYATIFAPPNSIVRIYIVDPESWTLTEAPSSPLPGFSSIGNLVADPTGPFVYQSTASNQVRVYSVDPATGYLLEVANSPFTAPGFGLPVAFSVDAGSIQPVTGPVATLTPPTLALGNVQVGTPSNAQL